MQRNAVADLKTIVHKLLVFGKHGALQNFIAVHKSAAVYEDKYGTCAGRSRFV